MCVFDPWFLVTLSSCSFSDSLTWCWQLHRDAWVWRGRPEVQRPLLPASCSLPQHLCDPVLVRLLFICSHLISLFSPFVLVVVAKTDAVVAVVVAVVVRLMFGPVRLIINLFIKHTWRREEPILQWLSAPRLYFHKSVQENWSNVHFFFYIKAEKLCTGLWR